MRALAVLTEELESRPGDADRVDALARHLRAVGRQAGALAGEWLVAGARTARILQLPPHRPEKRSAAIRCTGPINAPGPPPTIPMRSFLCTDISFPLAAIVLF